MYIQIGSQGDLKMNDGKVANDDRKSIVREFIENNFFYIKGDIELTDDD